MRRRGRSPEEGIESRHARHAAVRRGDVGLLQQLAAVRPEQYIARRDGVARRIVEDAAQAVGTEGLYRIRPASHKDSTSGGRDGDGGYRETAAGGVMAESHA